jgi:hypothetical protein
VIRPIDPNDPNDPTGSADTLDRSRHRSRAAARVAAVPFTADRSASEADRALRRSLAALDDARRCAALWFAEILDRRLYRDLGHPTIEVYAHHALGFSANRTRQFIALARRLRRMPYLREAVARGRIGWTVAQEVGRIVTPASEAAWVERAAKVPRAKLRDEIAAARRASRQAAAQAAAQVASAVPQTQPALESSPVQERAAPAPAGDPPPGAGRSAPPAARAGATAAAVSPPTTPEPGLPPAAAITVTVRLEPLQYARFEALCEAAKKAGAVPATADRAEIVLAGLAALTENPQPVRRQRRRGAKAGAQAAPAGPAAQVVLRRCPRCGATDALTGLGEKRLDEATAAALHCDAVERDARGHNRSTIPPAVRRQVLDRDGHRCTTDGCTATRFLEVHHLVPRADGGSNRPENLVTLCHRCHRAAHEHRASGGG